MFFYYSLPAAAECDVASDESGQQNANKTLLSGCIFDLFSHSSTRLIVSPLMAHSHTTPHHINRFNVLIAIRHDDKSEILLLLDLLVVLRFHEIRNQRALALHIDRTSTLAGVASAH